MNKKEEMQVLKWIQENLQVTRYFNHKCNSYRLKHICEEDIFNKYHTTNYVSNEDMKRLMLESYFSVYNTFEPNWEFNFKFKKSSKYDAYGNLKQRR